MQVPEGRLLFPKMTVRENLEMGGFTLKRASELLNRKLGEVHELLPLLKERAGQLAGTLSGGSSNVAIGRAPTSAPRLMMFDEPSPGLAPKLVRTVFDIVVNINNWVWRCRRSTSRTYSIAAGISHCAYVMENGAVALQGGRRC